MNREESTLSSDYSTEKGEGGFYFLLSLFKYYTGKRDVLFSFSFVNNITLCSK